MINYIDSNAEDARKILPYRKVAECYLVKGNKILAQDQGHFLSLPGGGINKNEKIIEAAKREVYEETGAIIRNSSWTLISTIRWDWHKEWANNAKRKERYNKFRGEEVYSFVGQVEKFENPTSIEEDDWQGEIMMKLSKAKDIMTKYFRNSNQYTAVYDCTKFTIISLLKSQIVNFFNKS